MGFFDRFRKRVKEVADDTDIDSLTVDEESEEAQEAIAKRQQIKEEQEAQSEVPQVEATTSINDDWEDVEEIEAISETLEEEEDEWDDWDDEPIPEPISPSLDKKQRKRFEKEAKEAIKERQRLKKEGFDVDQDVRPDGSKIDLQIMRSTTGRKLVEVKSAPRGSTGPTAVETDTGKTIEIDLGGGVVESGGKIIKGGVALDAMLEELELVMLEADMGRASIEEVITALRNELVGNRLRKGADLSKVVEASLKRALRTLLSAGYWDFDATVDSLLESGDLPVVIMMVGVNGTGKTTTTAKIAHRLKNKDRRVVLAASDTFRAGAIDQLETHAKRLNIRCVSSQRGGDAAAIARDAIEHAKARKMDVVIVDTAGRMQNKSNLMEELRKVHRVTKPHLVLFVGDALAGNDAVEQAKEFQRMLKFDGAVLCKLDTDAKGGAALSIAHATDKPIVLAGVGQEYDDLKQFDPDWLIEEVFT
uniref:Signal recognition particle receptor FtsY n=2 Tax=environmental samples TaxID=68359 RepID=A0A075GL72_9EURY|nr:signal recognition particle-docking protein (ftsY) [uncultured marine group II/III euryarchaeote KM3_115_D07]AIF02662.1 signal recognition particle-docking protein (ftsY) [uncultured marine group II/III euryarchaeote KM3_158_G08]